MSASSRLLRQVRDGGTNESDLTSESEIEERARTLFKGSDERERAVASLLKVADTADDTDDEDDTGASEVLDGMEGLPRRVRRLGSRVRGSHAGGEPVASRGTQVTNGQAAQAAVRPGPVAPTGGHPSEAGVSGLGGVRSSPVRSRLLKSAPEGNHLLRPSSSAGYSTKPQSGGTSVPPFSTETSSPYGQPVRDARNGGRSWTAPGRSDGGAVGVRGMVSDRERVRAHLDTDYAVESVSQEMGYGTSESARYLVVSPAQMRTVEAAERLQTGAAALATKGSETATSVTAGAAGAIVAAICVLICVFVALALSLAAIFTTSIAQEQLSPEGVAACAGKAYTEGETRGDWWWRGDRYRSLCGSTIGPWDAAFVCWCLSTCGLADEGFAPLVATTPELVDFYLTHPEAGQVISHDAAYAPRVGDLLVEGLGEEGVTPHVSIVVETDGSALTYIEGDAAGGARGTYDAGADGIGGYVVARQREASESDTYIHINFEGVG